MLFNSIEYLLLLSAVLAAYRFAPPAGRKWALVAGCVVFYVWWSAYAFLLLMLVIGVNYFFTQWGERSPRRRKTLFVSAIVFNLSCIGFFKYLNFFMLAACQALGLAGARIAPPRFDIVLPLGISFYTFHLMSYTIDVHRGTFKERKSFSDFFLFGAFFPTLVAGPILRAGEFFGQELFGRVKWEDVDRGARLILLGMFQKLVLADAISVFADGVFGNTASLTTWTALFGTYAYTFQIYFDFAGYTLIALGSARIFGIALPPNFNAPYLSPNIGEFWRRWHMSLSRWMRDYLYVSLGGSRAALPRILVNLFVTMAVVGLWHGASWNFVIWGVYHGLLLIGYNIYSRTAAGRRVAAALGGLPGSRLLGIALTFNLAAAGWIFFRARNLSDALAFFNAFVHYSGDFRAALKPYVKSMLFVAAGFYSIYSLATSMGINWFERLTPRRRALVFALVAVAIICFRPSLQKIPFIYFQF
jgi:D-alanyl-lipoteichoic acid acyltransferase DltB (MBOAT superfamily)